MSVFAYFLMTCGTFMSILKKKSCRLWEQRNSLALTRPGQGRDNEVAEERDLRTGTMNLKS
jgi:hypothetical protein